MDTLSFMANAYYALRGKTLRPYAGGGIGFARHSAKVEEIEVFSVGEQEVDVGSLVEIGVLEADDTVFAYQFMAGLGIGIMENLEARIGYRFFGTKTTVLEEALEASYHTHNLELGLLYRF